MEVIQPMAKKIKLSDAAKDLNVSSQEILSYFAEKGDTKKKSGSSLTEDEMNLLLEHYTKANEVSSFDGYFASKDQPKPVVKKAEPETAEKGDGRKRLQTFPAGMVALSIAKRTLQNKKI